MTGLPDPLSQGLEPALISVTGDSLVLQLTFRDRLSKSPFNIFSWLQRPNVARFAR